VVGTAGCQKGLWYDEDVLVNPGVLVVQWLGCRTVDQAVVGSTASWGAIKSPRSTQPSLIIIRC